MIEDYDLFEQFMFRRATATKVVIDGREYVMVGSMWEFVWSYMDDTQRRVIEFGPRILWRKEEGNCY